MSSVARPVIAVAFSSLAVVAFGAPQDDRVVPVHQEPRHHLVFDSPGTRILDVQIPPGDMTLYHTHSDPILYVTMSTSQTRSQTLGGGWSGGDASQGPVTSGQGSGLKPPASGPRQVPAVPGAGVQAPSGRLGRMTSTTSYATKPLTHRVNNVGPALFRLIGVINRSAGDESTEASGGFDQTPEIANRWFRGYRWALTASPSEHRHANPVAIVLITGRTVAAGATRTVLDEPGAFAWIEADTAHSIQAVGETAEVVEVEVRRPRIVPRD